MSVQPENSDTSSAAKSVGILVFEDVEELDFVGPLEVFGMARTFGANCSTLVIAETASLVRCRHGLRVRPDMEIDRCPALDMLIVPGGLGARTHARNNDRILAFVRAQTGMLVSVCTGALILASAGVLDGNAATTHHASLDALREYPRVSVLENTRFVISERLATSAGVSAGIDLALELVRRMWGAAIADRVLKNLEWTGREQLTSTRGVCNTDGPK